MLELGFAGAMELALGIRERRVSAADLVEVMLDRVGRLNPPLNAIVTLDAEGARRRAAEADAALARGELWGALHGVPVTFKDAFETAGLRTTSSYAPLAGYVPTRDATVVARLRQAGAIVLGKTNMPQLASDNQSDSPLFGRANNPWDVARTPGGSSGGEAAAVSAGLSPLGTGSDMGGSLRLPAHFCGVLALKPTEHRVSNAGHIPPLPDTIGTVRYMAVNGPLARTVADLRLWLTLVAGPDGRDSDVPPAILGEVPARPLRDLRLAWTDDLGGLPVAQDTQAALMALAKAAEAGGATVERTWPRDLDVERSLRTLGELYGAMIHTAQPRFAQLAMRTIGPLMFRDAVFGGAIHGMGYGARDLLLALARRDEVRHCVESFLSGYDAWLCPVAAVSAFPHRTRGRPQVPLAVDGQRVSGTLATMGHTGLFSLTGHPVVVLPLARPEGSLPIGVQVVGRLWGEMDLLAVAQALTELTGPPRHPAGCD